MESETKYTDYDKEIVDLKKQLAECTGKQDTKAMKFKAQATKKLKDLEAKLKEKEKMLESLNIEELHNRIAELEEEKGALQLKLINYDEIVLQRGYLHVLITITPNL